MATVKVYVHVFRNLKNREDGEDDQSPLEFELHRRRENAVTEIFDQEPDLKQDRNSQGWRALMGEHQKVWGARIA